MNESQPCERLSGSVDSRRLLEFTSLFVAANLLLCAAIGILRPQEFAPPEPAVLLHQEIEKLEQNRDTLPLEHLEDNGHPDVNQFNPAVGLPNTAPLKEGIK